MILCPESQADQTKGNMEVSSEEGAEHAASKYEKRLLDTLTCCGTSLHQIGRRTPSASDLSPSDKEENTAFLCDQCRDRVYTVKA